MTENNKPTSWERIASRLVELVTNDPELHDAVVRAINASADVQESKAEHNRALAEYKRLVTDKAKAYAEATKKDKERHPENYVPFSDPDKNERKNGSGA